MNLLEIRLDGEVVLEAPIVVKDREKARKALLLILERGTVYGVDAGLLGMAFKATAETLQSPYKSVGTLLQASTHGISG